MSAEQLGIYGGNVISLGFSYVPKLKDWFDKLSPDYKRLVMLGSLAAIAAGSIGLSCLGRYDAFTCDVDGAWKAGEVFILAAIANQSAYMLSPKRG